MASAWVGDMTHSHHTSARRLDAPQALESPTPNLRLVAQLMEAAGSAGLLVDGDLYIADPQTAEIGLSEGRHELAAFGYDPRRCREVTAFLRRLAGRKLSGLPQL